MDNNSKFPRIQKSTSKGENGLTIVKNIVEQNLGWLFRQNHLEHDFGIDAYIDVITDSNQVTGKSIAIQVKTGSSFFDEANEIGFVFRGDIKHLNYYMNLPIPILIVIVDDIGKMAFWEVFKAEKVIQAGENWKMTIPLKNTLSIERKETLKQYVGPVTDYVSQFADQWELDKILNEGNNRIILRVDKTDVLNNNIEPVLFAMNRFQQSSELILSLKSSIDISFDDFENDSRELYEIQEVKLFLDTLYNSHNCWPYLIAMDKTAGFIMTLFCHFVPFNKGEYDESGKYKIEFDTKECWPFIESLFHKLNTYCEEVGLSDKTNIEITQKITSYFMN
jgi:hypothetical protein